MGESNNSINITPVVDTALFGVEVTKEIVKTGFNSVRHLGEKALAQLRQTLIDEGPYLQPTSDKPVPTKAEVEAQALREVVIVDEELSVMEGDALLRELGLTREQVDERDRIREAVEAKIVTPPSRELTTA